MATELIHNELHVISLDKKEIVDLIGLLAAQLGEVALSGNASGAIPSVNIVDKGSIKYRLAFCLVTK